MKLLNWLQNLYIKLSMKHILEMQRIEDSIKFQIRDIEAIHQDFLRIESNLNKMWEILKRWE